jgi:hypothetical protein
MAFWARKNKAISDRYIILFYKKRRNIYKKIVEKCYFRNCQVVVIIPKSNKTAVPL